MLQGMTVHYLCHSTYEVQPGNGVIIHPGPGKTPAARGPAGATGRGRLRIAGVPWKRLATLGLPHATAPNIMAAAIRR